AACALTTSRRSRTSCPGRFRVTAPSSSRRSPTRTCRCYRRSLTARRCSTQCAPASTPRRTRTPASYWTRTRAWSKNPRTRTETSCPTPICIPTRTSSPTRTRRRPRARTRTTPAPARTRRPTATLPRPRAKTPTRRRAEGGPLGAEALQRRLHDGGRASEGFREAGRLLGKGRVDRLCRLGGERGGVLDEERHEPVIHLLERRGAETVVAVLTVFANGDEPGLAEHLEVLGDGGLGDAEFTDDLRDARAVFRLLVALEEHAQNVAAGAVGDHSEDVGHTPQRMPYATYTTWTETGGDTMNADLWSDEGDDQECPTANLRWVAPFCGAPPARGGVGFGSSPRTRRRASRSRCSPPSCSSRRHCYRCRSRRRIAGSRP